MTEISISGYRICEPIGAGNTGEVFDALECEGNTPVAIKRFRAMAIDRHFLKTTCERLGRAPQHPGLVDVQGFDFDRLPYHVVMERLEEGSALGNREETFPEKAAWPAIYEMAEALDHWHRHGIGHGNLHPGNVHLDDGRIRLTDFGTGLVGRFHHVDPREAAWFCPPEQLEQPDATNGGSIERWDVYHFGAVAFWMITGEVPRGHRSLDAYRRQLLNDQSRQVACDPQLVAADLREQPPYEWSKPAERRADQLRREIVDRCLAIEPAERPTDMREVWTRFEKLETQFELENAKVQVCEERTRQLGKLNLTRAVAGGLATGLVAVSAFHIHSLNRNRHLNHEVGDLAAVVERQTGTIQDYEARWTESLEDLKEFRSTAGSIFSQMSKSSDMAAGDGGIEHDVLEQSRAYFLKTLEDLGDTPEERFERARCLHNLAHVEAQLKNVAEAQNHYCQAAERFEAIVAERAEEVDLIAEIDLQLLDCYKRLAGFAQPDPGAEKLAALQRTREIYEKIAARSPDDRKIVVSKAINDLALGEQLRIHRRVDEAITVLASAGEEVASLREEMPGERMLSDILSRIQFEAARALRQAGWDREAIDSHLAALETVAEAADGERYTREQRRRLGLGYVEMGELFADHAEDGEIRTHFNEAMRLLKPLCEDGFGDPETAIFLSRTMAHIAKLERNASHWTDGYKMSLAAIENLEAALESHPGHIESQLTLVELRVSHTETLRYNRNAALRCLDNGLTMTDDVYRQVEDDEVTVEPIRKAWRKQLATIYDQYHELCESFGETEKAELCAERANKTRELLAQQGT